MTSRILVFARSGLLALLLLFAFVGVACCDWTMICVSLYLYTTVSVIWIITVQYKCTDCNWYLNPSAIRNSIINEQCCVLSIQFANDQLTVLMTVAVARHPYYFKTVSNCMTFKISGVSYFEFVKSIMKASYRSDPLLIMLNLHSMFNILYLHSIIVLYTATRFVPACIIIHQFA